jgi:hypothetical protein
MIASESDLTERLDKNGLLSDSHGAGVYALRAVVPDTLADVREAWDNQHDHRPPDDGLERLADAERVAYVGASSDMYSRLSDHVTHKRRQTAFLSAFPPDAVVDLWPTETPFDAEYNRALRLARDDWRVWTDGEILG